MDLLIIKRLLKKESRDGFSITEMLVVIFIIAILSTLVAANYKEGQKQYAVSRAAQQLAADLRRAQNLALAVRTEPVPGKEDQTACGYGIYTVSSIQNDTGTQYNLFYNIDPSCSPPNCDCGNAQNYYTNNVNMTQTLEEISLPDNVQVSWTPSGGAGNLKAKSTYFLPPDPKTYVDDRVDRTRIFTLTWQGSGYAKTIIVTPTGSIDID